MFTGQYSIDGAKELSRTKAPPKAKFFMWLALLGRCWTNDWLQRHHMQNDGPCSFCLQEDETVAHLLLGCVFSRENWLELLRASENQQLTPQPLGQLPVWWSTARKQLPKMLRKGFDCLVVLVSWLLWKERNRRVFDRQSWHPTRLLSDIRNEAT